MRLLVVRCLAFVVVQAVMRPRVRSRAGNGGQSQSRFQSDGGLSRLRFDRQLRFAVARIRSVRELGRQNVSRFIGRALFNGGGIVGFDTPARFRFALLPARSSLGGTEWIQSNAMKLRRECRCSGVRSRGTE